MPNITLGQYYPTSSYIHGLDPRTKLLSTLVYITMLFFVTNFFGYAFVVLCLGFVIYMSNVPPKFMFRGLKPILLIICFTVFLNIFFTPGERVVLQVGTVKITLEGLIIGAQMAMRYVLLIVGSSILTLTTSPIELTDAIEYLLKPFKKIGVPAHEIAMMMTIALRFIPTLLDEMDKIMKAQMARGADFDTGGLIKKAKALIPLLVPLFISAFRRADELAMAMEARCYRGDVHRTKMKVMKLYANDYRVFALDLIFIVICSASSFLL